MSAPVACRWTGLMMLLASMAASGAEDYWHYSYKGIDVTAAGSAEYASSLAHNMYRLDKAVVTVLGLELGDWRPTTRILSMPASELQKVLAVREAPTSQFSTNGFTNLILIDNGANGDQRFWGAYFGYAGSLLVSEGALRYPDWFRKGVSEVFAATDVQKSRVRIGGFTRNQAGWLMARPLIPMRRFLHLRWDDPQLHEKDTEALYDSESWFLTHLIMIEKKPYGTEFQSYLDLTSKGKGEDDAFAASFKVSYEQVDTALASAVRSAVVREMVIDIPDEPVSVKPERLSVAATKARMAEIAVTKPDSRAYGLKLATDALSAEPNNEVALRALAVAQVDQEQFADALATANKLAAAGTVAADTHAQIGWVLLRIAEAIQRKRASVADDPAALVKRAYDNYQLAMGLAPENLGYWSAMAEAIREQQDFSAAREFLPKIEQVFYLHPRNSALASSIARMSGEGGNLDDALKFAVAWQGNAIDERGQAAAAAYISRIKAAMERRSAATGTTGPPPAVIPQ